MNIVFHRARWSAVVLAMVSSIAWAESDDRRPYDVRIDRSEAARTLVESYRGAGSERLVRVARTTEIMKSSRDALAHRVPALKVEENPVTGLPEIVCVGTAPTALTGPSVEKPETALRNFVSSQAGLFGLTAEQAAQLKTHSAYTNPAGNLSWVELEQMINGIPVFQGTIRAAIRNDGAIIRTMGNLAAALDDASLPTQPKLSAVEAVVAGASAIGVAVEPAKLKVESVLAGGKTTVLEAGPFDQSTKAELTYFPVEPGVARLAYAMVLWEKIEAFYVLIDAESGQLLWRKNITNDQSQTVTYSIYPSDSPAPLSPSNATPGSGVQGVGVPRETVTLVSELPDFDNLGWIPDGNNVTTGNNVDAGLDIDGSNGVDANGRATGTPSRVFSFNYIPAGQPGEQQPSGANYRLGAVTNLFFWTNRFHDRLYQYGFTEAARNFQTSNFNRGGAGSDRVSAEAQDSIGTNNANFATPPDGSSGRMQMFIFDQPNPSRDGSLDQEIVIHELTHGLSNRLHANGSGLNTNQSGGMGEGWSDFYARCLLSTADEDIAGVYASGGYSTRNFFGLGTDNYYYGIRRFPYALIANVGANGRPHNPLTFGDISPALSVTADGAFAQSPVISPSALEVHNVGEVWCMILLEMRARLIARHGFQAGNDRTLQIVTDGMKLDPASPTLIQARDSIIAADVAGFGGEDVDDIWAGFAARGMGFNSSVTSSAFVVESFITPNLILGPITFSDATTGNNNGFADPGESIELTVPIQNLLTSTATAATVAVGGGLPIAFGDIAPNTSVTRTIVYQLPFSAASGELLNVPVAIDSSFGPVGPRTPMFPLVVGRPIVNFTERFDGLTSNALPGGWSTSTTGNGQNWASTTTNADTPARAGFTPNRPTVASAQLTTPPIPINSGSATLTFRTAFNLEVFQGIFAFDGMVLEASVDDGPFADILATGAIFQSGGYNFSLEFSDNPLSSRSAWSGNSSGNNSAPGYITAQVLLPPFMNGTSVRFRWIVGSDSSVVAQGTAGAWIDGVAVANDTTSTPASLPPVVTASPGSATYLENQPATAIDPGLEITDPDSPNLAGGTVTITENFTVNEDVLSFANQNGVSGTYNRVLGTLTLSGNASVATYQAALRNVAYSNASNNPSTLPRTVTFLANDGAAFGAATRTLTVTPINDTPQVDEILDPPAVSSNAGLQTTLLAGVNAGGGESQSLTVTATSDNPALIPDPTVNYTSPAGAGSLIYRSISGQSGSAVITVTVTDDGGTANGGINTFSEAFTVTVLPTLNTPPTVVASGGSNDYLEDGPPAIVDPGIALSDADSAGIVSATIAITAGFEPGQDTLDFTPPPGITGSYDGNTGTLTLAGGAPVANYQAALRAVTFRSLSDNPSTAPRTLTFTVDDGADADSLASTSRELTVTPVNDAPTLDPIPNPEFIVPDSPTQTIQLTGISAGGGETQNLTVTATSDHPELIPNPSVEYGSPAATGSVSYAPAPGLKGTAMVTVTVTDDGGNANGGKNSFSESFTVRVKLGNEAPSFDGGPDIVVAGNSGLFSMVKWASNISAGPIEENDQILNFMVEVDNPRLFFVRPTISTNGSLVFTAAENASGSARVTVRLHDDGGVINGGMDTSPPQVFTISISSFKEEVGKYFGLIVPAVTAPSDHAHFGSIQVVISRKGAVTARLLLGGERFTTKGSLQDTGVVIFSDTSSPIGMLVRKDRSPLSLKLNVDTVNGSDRLSGSIANGNAGYASLTADRAIYTVKKNPRAPLINVPASVLGKYTLAFPAKTPEAQGQTADSFPQGAGIGFVTVKKNGSAKLVGRLADGTKISTSGPLSKNNVLPFYVLTDKKRGSITGPLSIRDLPDAS
ncbi:MAG: M36 family metallopeptidase, partial [Chthoniobacteraceae bacterium]